MPIVPFPTTQTRSPKRDRPVVLLIDDNTTQMDLYSLVIKDRFDVLKATHGSTGYELACAERPNAIVLDILMPGINGWTVLQKLRANPATAAIPVIVLTGDESEAAVKPPDVAAVFRKPCRADLLLETLEHVIRP